MIFNRTFYLSSSKSANSLKSALVGQKIKVHNFDFEVVDKDNLLKIIPHAEDAEGVLTLPICNLKLTEKNSKTRIVMATHPRRIDIGGPYILVILCAAIFFTGFCLGLYGGIDFTTSSKWMMGIGLTIFLLFWLRMEFGYFDYVRKLKKFVKSKL